MVGFPCGANIHGGSFGEGMANYYATECRFCGKPMKVVKAGEEHEDEWHRGYCSKCAPPLLMNARPLDLRAKDLRSRNAILDHE